VKRRFLSVQIGYFKGADIMKNNNSKSILVICEAGLLIALLVVVQLLTFAVPKAVPIVGQLFTGTLVNLVLIMGAGSTGFFVTAAAAILSPVIALLFGQMNFPQMIPIVAAGNLVIVAVTWLFFRKDSKFSKSKAFLFDIGGIVLGAALKTLVLWGTSALIAVPLFFAQNAAVGKKIILMFSWPQFITALIGGIIAVLIVPRLRRAVSSKQ
jgi:hypothetical protein